MSENARVISRQLLDMAEQASRVAAACLAAARLNRKGLHCEEVTRRRLLDTALSLTIGLLSLPEKWVEEGGLTEAMWRAAASREAHWLNKPGAACTSQLLAGLSQRLALQKTLPRERKGEGVDTQPKATGHPGGPPQQARDGRTGAAPPSGRGAG